MYKDGFVIEYGGDHKKISCSDCVHYEAEDKSCNAIGEPINEIGYSYWKYCKKFCLSDNAKYKGVQLKSKNKKANSSGISDNFNSNKSNYNTHSNESQHQYIGDYILLLNIKEIIIPRDTKKAQITDDRIKEMQEHYERDNNIDRPIIVTRRNKQYFLKDGYDSYCFAIKKGMKSVPAMIDGKTTAMRYWICKKNRKLIHKSLGEGTVADFGLKYIWIKFNNKTKQFLIDDCMKKSLFK